MENLSDEDCFETSSFEVEVGSIPVFEAPLDWIVCDDIANDGL